MLFFYFLFWLIAYDPLGQIGHPVITEDTALCFTAMNGLPGPYIKFFLLELGHEGTSQYPCAFQLQAAAHRDLTHLCLLVWSFCFRLLAKFSLCNNAT